MEIGARLTRLDPRNHRWIVAFCRLRPTLHYLVLSNLRLVNYPKIKGLFHSKVRFEDMASPKGRILYVEDDPDSRELVRLLLKREGFEVISTENALESLKVLRHMRFDLFIVDVRLPDMSGFDLCSKLREYSDNIPILFFSGAAQEADKKQALECGASSYLVKPLDADSLVTEVSRLTRKNY